MATGRSPGLAQFEGIEDIAIVAAPGASVGMSGAAWQDSADAVAASLLHHCKKMRYRVAGIDCCIVQSVSEVRALRSKLDSAHGALYYPWVKVAGADGKDLLLPPSGFVAGIYARNDVERGVQKSPASEMIRSATGFEVNITNAQQDELNPEGVNCLRSFDRRGHRVWGARTLSTAPDWQYVHVRRHLCYLERSIDKGTQWAAFEPNLEAKWAKVRQSIEDFLYGEWHHAAMPGDKPGAPFFVRCDRSTMMQDDLDNGRLVCLVGVAPLKPAEFIVFRIGQWTAHRKV